MGQIVGHFRGLRICWGDSIELSWDILSKDILGLPVKYSYKPMERKFVPSNRQDWVPSGIQALKFVIFADMSIEDCWSFVKRANKSTK